LSQETFAAYPFAQSVFEDLTAAGFERPTPVQAACIPPALEGRDIIGLAQTGTGKTAAFALPIIQKLAGRTELGALVLAPTRELAAQITAVFEQLGRSSGIRVSTIVGGVPMDHDYKALKSWPNVLVATPGRLIDHLDNGKDKMLGEVEVFAVDEADRMHDMGFIPQLRRIIRSLPENRQTMMFTATMPQDVERIARQSMRDPLRIQIGLAAPVAGAQQHLYAVSEDNKTPLLLDLLRQHPRGRVLVFMRTKLGVDRLARAVRSRGVHVARIHGDREQCDRDEAMGGFRTGRYRVLIATDIAARGIDVADIEHVINYDFPRSADDYVHRVGRTARQDATGLASSFVTGRDRMCLADVKRVVGDRLPAPVAYGEPEKPREHGSHGRTASGAHGHGYAGGARAHGHVGEHTPRPVGEHAAYGHAAAHSTHVAAAHAASTEAPAGAQTHAGEAAEAPAKPRRRRRGGRGRGRTVQPAAESQTNGAGN
jgi:ATP-dependent RNA helicase RhlE